MAKEANLQASFERMSAIYDSYPENIRDKIILVVDSCNDDAVERMTMTLGRMRSKSNRASLMMFLAAAVEDMMQSSEKFSARDDAEKVFAGLRQVVREGYGFVDEAGVEAANAILDRHINRGKA